MIEISSEDIKDIKATPKYSGNDSSVSDEPFKDSLSVFIELMEDHLNNFKIYSSRDQSEMKTSEVDSLLKGIDVAIQSLRKVLYPNRNKKK